MVAISRGLWLATLCVLVAACPMPNPAWVDSATSESNGSDSASGSMSEGTASAGETTTGTTSAVTVTEGSTEPTSTEPTTATATATTVTSDATTSGTSTDATSVSSTDSDASSSTGGPTCESLQHDEIGDLNLVLEVDPLIDVPEPPECLPGYFDWTGAPTVQEDPNTPGRWLYTVKPAMGPCAGAELPVTVTGSYPAKPNTNNADCVRIRVFVEWNEQAQTCSKITGFEVIRFFDPKELRFAAASGRLGLSDGDEVTPTLVEGCAASESCTPDPGIYSLKSTIAMSAAEEQGFGSTALWDFYNRRSHVHDEALPNNVDTCLGHFDWILNYVGP